MDFEHVQVEIEDGIATLTLDRPERRNALHGPMWSELRAACAALADAAPRVVIVTGTGGHFSAGMDLRPDNPLVHRLAPALMSKDAIVLREIIEDLKACVGALADLPCPVIAAIEGACLGGGLEVALCADLRVVGQGARLGMPETRWGLVPDVGGTVRLARLVGRTRASDLILTGRDTWADEALAWGLANQVVPDGAALQAARVMAKAILRGAPNATAQVLAVLRQVDGLDDDAAFEAETLAGIGALVGQEALEGLSAFAERREPRWKA